MFCKPALRPAQVVNLRLKSVGSSTNRFGVRSHLERGKSGMSKTNLVSIVVSMILACAAADAGAYTYGASDFAVEVVEYVEGADVGSDWISGETFNNSDCALGRPTVDSAGDNWYIATDETVPVVAVYGPMRAFEVVSIGNGGSLTVRFDHKILDEAGNPYGLDLTIFGNAVQSYDYNNPNQPGWVNGDPNNFFVEAGGYAEPGIVSVSQDGQTWYTFTAPYADDFAPTLGREYDTENPDKSIGEWNNWWGDPTDPTLPLDPSLGFDSFDGWNIAQISQSYGESAGGTGFDISGFDLTVDTETGYKWIQYIRVADNPGSTATTEIDAFADVAAVPEPATVMMLVIGGLAILYGNKKR